MDWCLGMIESSNLLFRLPANAQGSGDVLKLSNREFSNHSVAMDPRPKVQRKRITPRSRLPSESAESRRQALSAFLLTHRSVLIPGDRLTSPLASR
jgi:hypothetical protein